MGHSNLYQLTDTVYRALEKRAKSRPDSEIIVLESQLNAHPESSKTYIAAFPKKKLVVRRNVTKWFEMEEIHIHNSNPWSVFKQFRKQSGWLFGFIGYDMKNHIESLSSVNPPLYDAPDLFMMEPSVLFKIENGRIEQLDGENIELPEKQSEIHKCNITSVKQQIVKNEYTDTVKAIKRYITEGDFYELNYSYPFTARFIGDSYELHRKMREINPVPFGSFIKLEDLSICCSSPERFLKNSGGHLMSEPIKGTSGRSTDPLTDKKLRNELKSPKNEAENLMIVDLVRHDLSKVSKPGSIRVSKLYDIQTFGTVHQLISRIEGTMMKDMDPVDAIRNCFPMGSMTGAPKLRVMSRIEELECYKRGIYSGSIGYFSPDGDFDFNVVIRSCIVQGNSVTYPVGGAITGDSDAEGEWNETLIKARVLTSLEQI